jgi:hypothetical protein
MFRRIVTYAGGRYVGVDLREDFGLDIERTLAAIEQHRPGMVILAYPNNPTGNLFDEDLVTRIVEAAPGMVVMDEAYHAFAGKSFAAHLGRHSNLLVMRTLSKLGLAGLRLGVLAGARDWMQHVDKVRLPYNVNVLTQLIAEKVLQHHHLLAEQAARIKAMVDSMRRLRPARPDSIVNGADDDGSGTATLLGIAKAFATGPKPKRSLMFLWFAGEERGLWGSRFHADYPTAPIDKIVANLNMDMVGRNRDDKPEEANSVYLVGSDRISTELHNIAVEANGSMAKPLKLDFELNDPTDLEQVYYRSDHYSYAAKGIPIVFFTTGLHPDYHYNTDGVEKINFEKMTRIGQLVYETGRRVANLDHAPVRDNRGPRVGKGGGGKIVE